MSHTEVDNLERVLRFVRKHSTVPLSIDTEGGRLRTGLMSDRVTLFSGATVRLVAEAFWGDDYTIPILPGTAIADLEPGTHVSLDFGSVLLRVDKVVDGSADATVLSGGEVGSRKAVTAFPSPKLPSFSPKDRVATKIALECGVREFAVSFCENAEAIQQFREMAGAGCTVVAKVESREGVRNFDQILASADKILIDRGDLSREVRIEGVPLLQKALIHRANEKQIPVYVATNLLESMVTHPTPSRAEVNDVLNTLIDGADGLVLAAETAIGRYPVEAARMIASLLREYHRSLEGYDFDRLLGDHPLASLGSQQANKSEGSGHPG